MPSAVLIIIFSWHYNQQVDVKHSYFASNCNITATTVTNH